MIFENRTKYTIISSYNNDIFIIFTLYFCHTYALFVTQFLSYLVLGCITSTNDLRTTKYSHFESVTVYVNLYTKLDLMHS